MRIRSLALFCAAGACLGLAAEKRVIFPPGAKPIGPYSPGIFAGDFLYVSGQGARDPSGKFASTPEAQVRQCLDNIKTIVEAAGLTMQHVVYTQLYMANTDDYDKINPVWKEAFGSTPPARATIGVARMPLNTPFEVSAVAVRDLSMKKAVVPPGYPPGAPVSPAIIAGDRVFLSGFLGRDINTGKIPDDPAAQVELAFDRIKQTLDAAGLDFRHLVFVNPYLTRKMPQNVMNKIYASKFEFGNTPGRATIQVNSLPHGANIEFTGIAARDLSQRTAVRPKNMAPSATASPCVFVADTFYCSAKSGFIPGPRSGIYGATVEQQVRQTMRNLLDGLEEAGLNFSNVVATNVYLDNIDDFEKMNRVYGQYFSTAPPTRTTVQQVPPGERKPRNEEVYPTLEQVSLVAVK